MLLVGALLLFLTVLSAPTSHADTPDEAAAGSPAATPPPAGNLSWMNSSSLVRTFYDEELGGWIDEVKVPGVPPELRAFYASSVEPRDAGGPGDVRLPDVPAFDWCYGCSATSAAMMFGYYDNGMYYPGNMTQRGVYSNMYAGPANGGTCPMNNSLYWGDGESPLSATHQGYDNLTVCGSVDDYWFYYGAPPTPYPYPTPVPHDPYYGNWTEHAHADCTADFMGTNQWDNFGNHDGETSFWYWTNGAALCNYDASGGGGRDGAWGMRLFVESRGYDVVLNTSRGRYETCSQYIRGYASPTRGYTLAQYKKQIDAGRPVLIHVTGHTMIGFGYSSINNSIDIHDTWDHSDHTMTWGGWYEGLQHRGVGWIEMEPSGEPVPRPPPPPAPAPPPPPR